MQTELLFDAPALPEARRDRSRPQAARVAPVVAARGQIALGLGEPAAILPEPVVIAPVVIAPAVIAPVPVPEPVPAPVVGAPAPAEAPRPPRSSRPMQYLVQAFVQGRHGLVPEPAIAARTAGAAQDRAAALARRKAGVLVYAVPLAAGEDDYPDAEVIARFGACPDAEM